MSGRTLGEIERDALLLDCAAAIRMLVGRELGRAAVTEAGNDELAQLHDRLGEALRRQRLAGVRDPHGLLGGRRPDQP